MTGDLFCLHKLKTNIYISVYTQASTIKKYSSNKSQYTSPPRLTNFRNPSNHLSDTRRQSRKKGDLAINMAGSDRALSSLSIKTQLENANLNNLKPGYLYSHCHRLHQVLHCQRLKNILSARYEKFHCLHWKSVLVQVILFNRNLALPISSLLKWKFSHGPLIASQAVYHAQRVAQDRHYNYSALEAYFHIDLLAEQTARKASFLNFGISTSSFKISLKYGCMFYNA